jgi:hypothetical protein
MKQVDCALSLNPHLKYYLSAHSFEHFIVQNTKYSLRKYSYTLEYVGKPKLRRKLLSILNPFSYKYKYLSEYWLPLLSTPSFNPFIVLLQHIHL